MGFLLHKFALFVHALHLFKALRLFFLTNLPGPTVIPCPTSIPDSRVTKWFKIAGFFDTTFSKNICMANIVFKNYFLCQVEKKVTETVVKRTVLGFSKATPD